MDMRESTLLIFYLTTKYNRIITTTSDEKNQTDDENMNDRLAYTFKLNGWQKKFVS